MTISKSTSAAQISGLAFRFVLIIGIANLFADMTYEGVRGIRGPFLGSLGGSATMIGFLVGFGELAGYALRSFSGYLADRSRKYWLSVFVGYAEDVSSDSIKKVMKTTRALMESHHCSEAEGEQ